MSIFQTGAEALKSIQEEAEKAAGASGSSMKLGNYFKVFFRADEKTRTAEKKRLRFLTPTAVTYRRHAFFNGREYITCIGDACEVCKKIPENRATQVGVWPVRWDDAPAFRDRPQNEEIRLWDGISQTNLKKLAGVIENYKDIRRYMFDVQRIYDPKQNSKDYNYLPVMDSLPTEAEKALMKEAMEIDWASIILPPSPGELESIFGRLGVGAVQQDRRNEAPAKSSIGVSYDFGDDALTSGAGDLPFAPLPETSPEAFVGLDEDKYF